MLACRGGLGPRCRWSHRAGAFCAAHVSPWVVLCTHGCVQRQAHVCDHASLRWHAYTTTEARAVTRVHMTTRSVHARTQSRHLRVHTSHVRVSGSPQPRHTREMPRALCMQAPVQGVCLRDLHTRPGGVHLPGPAGLGRSRPGGARRPSRPSQVQAGPCLAPPGRFLWGCPGLSSRQADCGLPRGRRTRHTRRPAAWGACVCTGGPGCLGREDVCRLVCGWPWRVQARVW